MTHTDFSPKEKLGVVSAERKVMIGNPKFLQISTSYVER
jgi:hypothetical protein